LAVVMGRRLMVRSSIVMMLAGCVLLFLCHGEFLLQKILAVSGPSALLTSVINYADSRFSCSSSAGMLVFATLSQYRKQKKSRRGRTPLGIRPRRLTRQLAPRHSRVALHLVIRRLRSQIFWSPFFEFTGL
jgi:hypothetical protein